ncbi:MAG: acyltransferase family protein, partial [Microcoleaceae cyanobacterium]
YNSKINRRHLKRDWIFIISLIGVFMVMHYNWNDVLIIPIFCLLILSASINNRVVAKILSSNIMVDLGAISYSIYMVHWFIQELIKQIWKETFDIDFASNFTLNESWIILSICFCLVIFAAALTYNFVEMPMRNKLKSTTFAKKYIYSG